MTYNAEKNLTPLYVGEKISVDTGISQAVRLKRIKNDIECPIYMLESTRIITISLQKELVGTSFRK